MSGYRIGSLFSGYGGLDLGVQAVFGGEIAWVSDIDKGPRKILAYHHPNVPNLGDITSVDWEQVEPVDIICGGSPCQDLSLAGCRAGMMAGTRSGLWESMLTAIQTIRPAYVVWENVKGAHSARAYSKMESGPRCVGAPDPTGGGMPFLRGTGRVLGDLANAGYDAKWVTIRASDVGAPHRRERVFVYAWRRDATAHPNRSGMRGRASESSPRQTPEPDTTVDGANNRPSTTRETSGLNLLPTPNTMDTLPAREGEKLAKAMRHGRTAGPTSTASNLREAVTLLPTPSTIDAKPVDVPHQMETRDNPGLHCAAALFGMPRELWPTTPGMDKTRLLPTPVLVDADTADVEHRMNTRDSPGLLCIAALLGYPKETWPTSKIMDAARAEEKLLPTPTARDYKDSRIGPPQHRPNDYDLLPRAVALIPATAQDSVKLLPTPTASRFDGRKSQAYSGADSMHEIVTEDKWGKFSQAIHRWENVLDRAAPSPVEPTGRNGTLQLSARFVEWMMGLPDGWVTGVPGISRTEAIKACGNGVVPQQAAHALQTMTQTGGEE